MADADESEDGDLPLDDGEMEDGQEMFISPSSESDARAGSVLPMRGSEDAGRFWGQLICRRMMRRRRRNTGAIWRLHGW